MEERMEMQPKRDPGIDLFPVDTAGLPQAARSSIVDVGPDETFDLRIGPVSKTIGDDAIRMLAYNGSIPGPTLRVRQGSEIIVHVVNGTQMETTVHWHGLRLENRYDGVPDETQAPIPPGGHYTHRLTFPDAGLFWYHPHMREDYAQEMGLYGNIIVEPADPSYWPPADRDVVLTLDDILIEDGKVAAYSPDGANFAAMGRYGNVLLTGGAIEPDLEVRRGEVVRFLLTDTANSRVFKVTIPGVPMKLVGNDGGHYEREQWVDDVVIAPSERAIFDVRFTDPGTFVLQHDTPGRAYPLAQIAVVDPPLRTAAADVFETLRVNADMVTEREHAGPFFDARPDKTLALVAEMDIDRPETDGPLTYVCPMHPEVVTSEPGKCPKCGMKLMTSQQVDAAMQADHEGAPKGHSAPHHDHGEALADGIEWEDLMPEVNRTTTSANMHWKLVDRDTGKEGADIDWTFDAGDLVKIRLVNEMGSDHPMHHPFHVHGERFLVLARDGIEEPNLVWKDTVLVRTGQVVDILLDASNPGLWMAHCHIAEHMESGMMFSFQVIAESD
ncbi:MAG TPA: multicopper oxidase family protein [Actinomycetota bacterium]|nr:multicopper oxidase family protein [Actinomycetota bacterium]